MNKGEYELNKSIRNLAGEICDLKDSISKATKTLKEREATLDIGDYLIAYPEIFKTASQLLEALREHDERMCIALREASERGFKIQNWQDRAKVDAIINERKGYSR